MTIAKAAKALVIVIRFINALLLVKLVSVFLLGNLLVQRCIQRVALDRPMVPSPDFLTLIWLRSREEDVKSL
jgi:hypothetical protein